MTIEPAAFAFEVADQTLAPGLGVGDVEVPDGAEGVAGEQVAGTVAWYLDEAHAQSVPEDWALEGEPGSAQVLYWSFTPIAGQSNYVDEALSGSVTLTVGEPAPEEPEPGDPEDPSGEGGSGEGSESDAGGGRLQASPLARAPFSTDPARLRGPLRSKTPQEGGRRGRSRPVAGPVARLSYGSPAVVGMLRGDGGSFAYDAG